MFDYCKVISLTHTDQQAEDKKELVQVVLTNQSYNLIFLIRIWNLWFSFHMLVLSSDATANNKININFPAKDEDCRISWLLRVTVLTCK